MLWKALLAALAGAVALWLALDSTDSRPRALAEPLLPTPELGVAYPARRAAPALPARRRKPAVAVRRAKRHAERVGLDAYAGAGAWLDMYDGAQHRDPAPALVEMRKHGVRTLYLETASWRVPKELDMKDEQGVGALLDGAHTLGINVVAWYLPGLDDLTTDLRRSRAALDFRSPQGQRFDGFAVDIESSRVSSIDSRNVALMQYSRELRRAAGRDHALGAIVPDLRSTTVSPGLWNGFPYAELATLYDVFLPMAYSSRRGHGGPFVLDYSRSNVSTVRRFTGRPVHLVGGLANELQTGEAAAVVAGARDGGAIGVSFYDFALRQDESVQALAAFR